MHLLSRQADFVLPLRHRGYTAWDCTSPAFVREDAARRDSLYSDSFLFLHRARLWIRRHRCFVPCRQSISRHCACLRLFGNTTSKKVTPSVGPEQEYFLVDRAEIFTEKRPDLYRPYPVWRNAAERTGAG